MIQYLRKISFTRNIHTSFFIIVTAIMGLIFVGCSHEDDFENKSSGEYLQLASHIGLRQMRVTDNNFEKDDRIGVYVVEYNEDNITPGQIGASNFASNKRHTFNGTEWLMDTGSKMPWPNRPKVDIYAYAPYSEALPNPKNYTFMVQGNQKIEERYRASDFLWAKSSDLSPTKDDVHLTFTHRMSKIKLNIKSENGFLADRLPNSFIRITNTKVEGSIDLSNGNVIPTETSLIANISPGQSTVTESGYEISLTGIIIPQTVSAKTDIFAIVFLEDGARYNYKLEESITFESGKEYTFDITLSPMKISVSTGVITDWISDDPIKDNMEELSTKVLNLNDIDWSKSLVQKVFDNNVQVAQVCKEYLFKSGSIDAQAIVVYPMAKGKPDLTNGFVAQVMIRKMNTVNNSFDPLQTSVHGGKVSWSDKAIATYTEGKQALFSKVEISNKGIIGVTDNIVYGLKAEPELQNDIDGNNYKLVKIGTQYWMTENLRVEHYRNGNPINYAYYNDDRAYKIQFGAMYDWNAIMDSQGIAPEGWHVPSTEEINTLVTYLGTTSAANKLSMQGDSSTDNITGFSGQLGGVRTQDFKFSQKDIYGYYWTTTLYSDILYANRYFIYKNNVNLNFQLNSLRTISNSVRLIRN